jgi:hypothetical protein
VEDFDKRTTRDGLACGHACGVAAGVVVCVSTRGGGLCVSVRGATKGTIMYVSACRRGCTYSTCCVGVCVSAVRMNARDPGENCVSGSSANARVLSESRDRAVTTGGPPRRDGTTYIEEYKRVTNTVRKEKYWSRDSTEPSLA